jgi:hypothetical protein
MRSRSWPRRKIIAAESPALPGIGLGAGRARCSSSSGITPSPGTLAEASCVTEAPVVLTGYAAPAWSDAVTCALDQAWHKA